MLTISEIYIYPIKSLSGISLQECFVEERGLQHDRRWVLADENNVHITQREILEMALLSVSVEENGLKVWHRIKRIAPINIPFISKINAGEQHNQLVKIWDDYVPVVPVSNDVDAWFQKVLGVNCRLFYQPDDSNRPIDPRYALENEAFSLADGYPILIAGQASIDDLNSRMTNKISVKRFRPNIVFTGGTPFIEDTIEQFKINEGEFIGVKNCARCPIPNIDPETAIITKDTIKTLASYRTRDNKVYFGQNVIVKKTGLIKIGDEIIC